VLPGVPVAVPSGTVDRVIFLSRMVCVLVLIFAVPALGLGPGPAVARAEPLVGGWGWPLPGPPDLVRGFDPPDTAYGPGHRGVDLAAAPGTPVLAAGAGVVSFAGVVAGRGVVAVQHPDGLRTTYEPLLAMVRVGQPVVRGEVLGTLMPGHLGCPRLACLHWGLRQGEAYRDPLSLVRGGPVRLLPWHQAPGAASAAGHPSGHGSAAGPPGRPAAGAGAPGHAGADAALAAAPARDRPDPWQRARAAGIATAMAIALAAGMLLAGRRPP